MSMMANIFREVRRWLAGGKAPHASTHSDAAADQLTVTNLDGVTTSVASPGADTLVPTEKAIRTALTNLGAYFPAGWS